MTASSPQNDRLEPRQAAIDHGRVAELVLHLTSEEEPATGRKLVAFYDDGSGAVLLYRYDGGYIEADGSEWADDHLTDHFDAWAYLPASRVFNCETWREDAYTFPAPPALAPDLAALNGRTIIEGVKPSAYLKFWWAGQRPRCRVDLSDVCEPWLDALNPQIVPLYAGDDLNAAFAAALGNAEAPGSACEAAPDVSDKEFRDEPNLPPCLGVAET